MTYPGTSQPLVPTGQEYGDRQANVADMQQAGLPTGLPSPAPPSASPMGGGARPPSAPSPPVDALTMLDPLGPAAPPAPDPLDEIEFMAQQSGNAFILGAVKRARGL